MGNNRDAVIRDLFGELASVLFGGSPMSTARVPGPFRRGRPDDNQLNSMAQRILSSRSWSNTSREGQEEAVRGMLTELTGALFGDRPGASEIVTSRSYDRSTATFETHTARSSGHGMRSQRSQQSA